MTAVMHRPDPIVWCRADREAAGQQQVPLVLALKHGDPAVPATKEHQAGQRRNVHVPLALQWTSQRPVLSQTRIPTLPHRSRPGHTLLPPGFREMVRKLSEFQHAGSVMDHTEHHLLASRKRVDWLKHNFDSSVTKCVVLASSAARDRFAVYCNSSGPEGGISVTTMRTCASFLLAGASLASRAPSHRSSRGLAAAELRLPVARHPSTAVQLVVSARCASFPTSNNSKS